MGKGFGLDLSDLRVMMEARRQEALDIIKEHGGGIGVCEKLNTSPTDGLTGDEDDLKMRQEVFGKNVIPTKKSKSFCKLLLEAINDLTLIILLVAATVSLILWLYQHFTEEETNSTEESEEKYGWIDSVAIYGTVTVVVFVTAINDYTKEKQFRGLQKKLEAEHLFAVIRNGTAVSVNVTEIVVGDLCQIKYGDLIPADGILLASNDLKIDEASLTGESDHVKKGEFIDPMILSGTHVMEGSGKVVVTAVGVNSQSGIIFSLLGNAADTKKEEKAEKKKLKSKKSSVAQIVEDLSTHDTKSKVQVPQNPDGEDTEGKSVLQKKLTKLAVAIGYFGMAAAGLTFLIMLCRFCVHTYHEQMSPWQLSHAGKFVGFFITGITILVVAVPEGLPLAVTLSLIFSCKKMMKDHNLVRHLDACETMGNATAICSDKTGTLTTNRMTVVRAYVCGNLSNELPKYDSLEPNFANKLVQSVCLNSSYTSRVEKGQAEGEPPTQIGNKTECGLLGFVMAMGKNYEDTRREFPEESFTRVYTFNSVRKSMSTVIPLPNGAGWRLFTKGASEIVMFKCTWIYGPGGKLETFTPQMQQELVEKVIEPMAQDALRTITLAYKDFLLHGASYSNEVSVKEEPNWDNEQEIVSNLTCLCLVGIEDPVRPEVPDAIKKCQRAGITVRMVTGDNINTARSIATKCGIYQPGSGGLILEGKEFNNRIRDEDGEVTQELLDKVWPSLRVLARSSPTDKYILVRGIINSHALPQRQVVAVTGDGTNDGPALKKADVGFAMGITGTDVAKEASDIILTDDNFTSIVKAVMWGRKVYDSIAKFLQFQLTVNIVAVSVAIIGALVISSSPLKATQMLWVNLIMDTLASLALATELPTPELLLRKPYGRTKSLVSVTMFKNMLGQSIYQLTVIMIILFAGADMFDIDDGTKTEEVSIHMTFIFNAFVIMTLFNEINCRKIHGQRNFFEGFFSNVWFLSIWFSTLFLQVFIVFVGDKVFKTYPLPLELWLWCFAFGAGTMAWAEVIASIPSKPIEKCLKKCACGKKKGEFEEDDEDQSEKSGSNKHVKKEQHHK